MVLTQDKEKAVADQARRLPGVWVTLAEPVAPSSRLIDTLSGNNKNFPDDAFDVRAVKIGALSHKVEVRYLGVQAKAVVRECIDLTVAEVMSAEYPLGDDA